MESQGGLSSRIILPGAKNGLNWTIDTYIAN